MTAPLDIAVELDSSWAVIDNLHGGYLLATIAGAVLGVADPDRHPHPLSASAMYVAPPAAGPATVRVRPLRAGRTIASYQATLLTGGEPKVEMLLTAGRLPGGDDPPVYVDPAAGPPHGAPLNRCVRPAAPRRDGTNAQLPSRIRENIDVRLDPSTTRWNPVEGASDVAPRGERVESDPPDVLGWARMLLDDFDPLLAQFILADAMPPTTFNLGIFSWAPTIQLNVLLRRVPQAGGWQQIRQRSMVVAGERFDEDCWLWDEAGNLTVQARQLAGYRVPPS